MQPIRALPIVLCLSALCAGQQPAADMLRQRADAESGVRCAQLSMQVAQHSVEDAHHLFQSSNSPAAHQAIDLAVHYAARSVDCTLQSRKHQKAVEIEIRSLIRRMRDVARTVDSEDRPQLGDAIEQLEQERDQLLRSIFGPAAGN